MGIQWRRVQYVAMCSSMYVKIIIYSFRYRHHCWWGGRYSYLYSGSICSYCNYHLEKLVFNVVELLASVSQ